MFSMVDRSGLLDYLVGQARSDESITAAALVGSLARHEADSWSDIDLALRVEDGAALTAIADIWTARIQRVHPVVDTLDIWAGLALYRVHILDNTLQVDLSLWTRNTFGSADEAFSVIFGESARVEPEAGTAREAMIGWGWLYALHVRSALARGRTWQAIEMLGDLRKQVVALACARADLPPFQGRGVDRLPAQVLAELERTMPGSTEFSELHRAFAHLSSLLGDEAADVDPSLGERLGRALDELVASSSAEWGRSSTG